MTRLPAVKDVITLKPEALTFTLAQGIEAIDDFTPNPLAAEHYFENTHLTGGLRRLLQKVTMALSSTTEERVFVLQQAMGGGKTHSMIAAAHLCSTPSLIPRVLPNAPESVMPARVVIFNGRKAPKNFLWGDVTEKLLPGRVTEFPSVEALTELFVELDRPVLIILDELPAYMEFVAASSRDAGDARSTLGLTKRFITNLLEAARSRAVMQGSRTRVVFIVGQLDGAYEEGAALLEMALGDVSREIKRGATTITPVDLSGPDAYDIIRKRFVASMPDDAVIKEIQSAYRSTLKQAERAGLTEAGYADKVANDIPNTFPFHPDTKLLLARVKENPDFRQTRGLLELTSLMLRSVMQSGEPTALVGVQHFDLGIPEVRERLNQVLLMPEAVAADVFDMNGTATTQEIDRVLSHGLAEKPNVAQKLAKVILVASDEADLGDKNGLRPTHAGQSILEPQRITSYSEALEQILTLTRYLHDSGSTLRFSTRLNINAAIRAAEVNVSESALMTVIKTRLRELFAPTRTVQQGFLAYEDLFLVDEGIEALLRKTARARTLIIVDQNRDDLTHGVQRAFSESLTKNNFLVLANTQSVEYWLQVEKSARRLAAIASLQESGAVTVEGELVRLRALREKAESALTFALFAALTELRRPVMSGGAPKLVASVIHFDESNHEFIPSEFLGALRKGEMQVIHELLTKRKLVLDAPGNLVRVRDQAQTELFGHDHVTDVGTLRRRASERVGFPFLTSRGLDELVNAAVEQRLWERLPDGRVSKSLLPRVPELVADAVMESPINPKTTHHIKLTNVTDHALVFMSTTGPATEDSTPQPTQDRTITITTDAPMLNLFLIDKANQHEQNTASLAWVTELPVAHETHAEPDGTKRVTLHARPDARVFFTLDGSHPLSSPTRRPYDAVAGIRVDADVVLCVAAELSLPDGRVVSSRKYEWRIAVAPSGDPFKNLPNKRTTINPPQDRPAITIQGDVNTMRFLTELATDADATVTNPTIKNSTSDFMTSLAIRGKTVPARDLHTLVQQLLSFPTTGDAMNITLTLGGVTTGTVTLMKTLASTFTHPIKSEDITQ